MNNTKAIAETILSTAEYTSRSEILRSVKRGNITSERPKPGIHNSKRKPTITLKAPKITGTVSISSTLPQ
jgi:metal-responsive CopG/Arc/MetJ family transcriptional regulator